MLVIGVMSKFTPLPKVASVQEVQRNYRGLFDGVKKSDRPLVLLRNNEPDVIIISPALWDEMCHLVQKKEELEVERLIHDHVKTQLRNQPHLRQSLKNYLKH
ncbi:MAG: Antitoxin [Candidatus Magasanikbacteria bacterium]|nr:Antitoxin [Candidatus Magasanikbacteria bacterium]